MFFALTDLCCKIKIYSTTDNSKCRMFSVSNNLPRFTFYSNLFCYPKRPNFLENAIISCATATFWTYLFVYFQNIFFYFWAKFMVFGRFQQFLGQFSCYAAHCLKNMKSLECPKIYLHRRAKNIRKFSFFCDILNLPTYLPIHKYRLRYTYSVATNRN